ncbi:hypothetical protein ACFV6G_25175 [Streptomyces lavendulae]|uniref:hypothetical protein n=1 Tax=Streptomyces lavendulae TaxID=1914 RepID=UPI003673DEA4
MTTADAPATVTATLAEMAALANRLCDQLADGQFETAARIRALAETAMVANGDH